jgi:hypothetical protein
MSQASSFYNQNNNESSNNIPCGKAFLYNVGNNFDFNKLSIFEENGTASAISDHDKIFLPPNKEKHSCWNCYKLITNETLFKSFDKFFCSEICLEKFLNKELVRIYLI